MVKTGLKLWPLKLVLPGRYGRWVTGVLIFAVLFAGFYLSGALMETNRFSAVGAALFFTTVMAYLVPIFHFITDKTQSAITELGELVSDVERVQAARNRISHRSLTWTILVVSSGLIAGLAHHHVISVRPFSNYWTMLPQQPALQMTWLGIMLVWSALMIIVVSLVQNGVVLQKLTTHVEFQLLQAKSVMPFGRVAVYSSLALLGALALFPLLFVGAEEMRPFVIMPGLIGIGIPLVWIFLLPLWRIHNKMRDAKVAELIQVNERLKQEKAVDMADAEQLSKLTSLLAYRTEIEALPEWPFDTGVMTRLSLYLIIPPLTWIGAALIENLVDGFL